MITYSLSSMTEKRKLNERLDAIVREAPKASFCPILSSSDNLEDLYGFLTEYLGTEKYLIKMENYVIILAQSKASFRTASGISTALTENFYTNHHVLFYRNPCESHLLESLNELEETYRSILRMNLRDSIFTVEDLFLVRILDKLPKEDLTRFLQRRTSVFEKLSYELRLTIKIFIEENLSMSRTAKALFIHRNTLTYRIQKIRQITGLDIRNFQEAIELLTISYFVTSNI